MRKLIALLLFATMSSNAAAQVSGVAVAQGASGCISTNTCAVYFPKVTRFIYTSGCTLTSPPGNQSEADLNCTGGGGGGTVTSVGLSLPASVFTVSGSPVVGAGTLTGTFNTQSANTVFAGPASGAAAVPGFRALVAADLPGGGTLAQTYANGAVAADDTMTIANNLPVVIQGGAQGNVFRVLGAGALNIVTLTDNAASNVYSAATNAVGARALKVGSTNTLTAANNTCNLEIDNNGTQIGCLSRFSDVFNGLRVSDNDAGASSSFLSVSNTGGTQLGYGTSYVGVQTLVTGITIRVSGTDLWNFDASHFYPQTTLNQNIGAAGNVVSTTFSATLDAGTGNALNIGNTSATQINYGHGTIDHVFTGSVDLTQIKIGNATGSLLLNSTAPTISAGFGAGASITVNNGTSNFRVNTGVASASGTIGLPSATNGWNCLCDDFTTQAIGGTSSNCRQTGGSQTTAVIGNFTGAGASANWASNDVLIVHCFAD